MEDNKLSKIKLNSIAQLIGATLKRGAEELAELNGRNFNPGAGFILLNKKREPEVVKPQDLKPIKPQSSLLFNNVAQKPVIASDSISLPKPIEIPIVVNQPVNILVPNSLSERIIAINNDYFTKNESKDYYSDPNNFEKCRIYTIEMNSIVNILSNYSQIADKVEEYKSLLEKAKAEHEKLLVYLLELTSKRLILKSQEYLKDHYENVSKLASFVVGCGRMLTNMVCTFVVRKLPLMLGKIPAFNENNIKPEENEKEDNYYNRIICHSILFYTIAFAVEGKMLDFCRDIISASKEKITAERSLLVIRLVEVFAVDKEKLKKIIKSGDLKAVLEKMKEVSKHPESVMNKVAKSRVFSSESVLKKLIKAKNIEI